MVWEYFYLSCHQKGFLSKFELFAFADQQDIMVKHQLNFFYTVRQKVAKCRRKLVDSSREHIGGGGGGGGILRHFKPFVVRIVLSWTLKIIMSF
jgi:hypothetical protein